MQRERQLPSRERKVSPRWWPAQMRPDAGYTGLLAPICAVRVCTRTAGVKRGPDVRKSGHGHRDLPAIRGRCGAQTSVCPASSSASDAARGLRGHVDAAWCRNLRGGAGWERMSGCSNGGEPA